MMGDEEGAKQTKKKAQETSFDISWAIGKFFIHRDTTQALAVKPADISAAHEQIVTPWDIQGSISSDGQLLTIDYDKLIDQFGMRHIDGALLECFEHLMGHRLHILLWHGMFFSHRCVLCHNAALAMC
jgi:hypothetical protein